MALVRALLRLFAWLYHGLLALFLLALSGMALAADMHSLRLDMLPWKGESLTWWLLGLSLVGVAAVAMSAKGVLPSVFFVWSVVVFGFLVKSYIFSGYHFGRGDFGFSLYMIAGAAAALAGSWYAMRRSPSRK